MLKEFNFVHCPLHISPQDKSFYMFEIQFGTTWGNYELQCELRLHTGNFII